MRLPGSPNNPRWDAWRIACPSDDTWYFTLWNMENLRLFCKERPQAFCIGGSRPYIIDHDAYDEFLFRNVAPYWAA